MNTFKDNLAGLIKVKTIVTLCVISVWMVLALAGKITSDSVTNLTLMVLSFYFGTQIEKKSGMENRI